MTSPFFGLRSFESRSMSPVLRTAAFSACSLLITTSHHSESGASNVALPLTLSLCSSETVPFPAAPHMSKASCSDHFDAWPLLPELLGPCHRACRNFGPHFLC